MQHLLDKVLHLKFETDRFFDRIKQSKCIATGYEKPARKFMSLLYFFCAFAWLA